MLSVGRELNIHNQSIICLLCNWEGAGAELSTGLVPVNGRTFSIYAYRCPACGSFNLNHRGKLLEFRLHSSKREANQETTPSTATPTRLSQRKGNIPR